MSTLRWMPSVLLVLALLALAAASPTPAHAGGVVTVCDEAHLLAALAGGGTVTFACNGTITLTAEIVIFVDTTIDGSGQDVTISGDNSGRLFRVVSDVTLNLIDTTISGGGISNAGTLVVNDSTFSDNSDSWNGGGIDNSGVLVINDSFFSDNSALLGGGFSNWQGVVTVTHTTFSGNWSSGISNGLGVVTVSDSTFSGNRAGCDGGGILNFGGALTVSTSTFSENSASDGCAGGGIFNYYDGTAIVYNSTFSGNRASLGGAVGNYDNGTVIVYNSTFSGNSASLGGAFGNEGGTMTLGTTIITNSLAGSNCFGEMNDSGGNLSYPDTTCPGINADPVLGPLHDNGGLTWTMALGKGSAAINAGDDAICAAEPVNNLDQRGVTRPQGAHCDIGAVEQVLDPTAVSLAAFGAGSVPGAMPPTLVFSVLLLALLGFGASRRDHVRH